MKLLHSLTRNRHFSQLWRFAVCGGSGFIFDFGSLTLFVEWLHIDSRIAVILSSLVGATFVFFANKFFTFKNHEKKMGNQALKFALVYGVALVMNVLISNLLIAFGIDYRIAKIVAVAIGAVWNYALSHGFIFKKKDDIDVVIV